MFSGSKAPMSAHGLLRYDARCMRASCMCYVMECLPSKAQCRAGLDDCIECYCLCDYRMCLYDHMIICLYDYHVRPDD